MTNKTIAAPAAECPCTPVTPVQFLTGNEAVKHLELLLAYMESPLAATKEMVSAYYQKARGYYCVKTVQSAADLIAAKAGASMGEVEKYLGFSCVGRFTGAKSPRKKPDGSPCNWTLGGLFSLHELEVVTEDGEHHPSFELATPEQAQLHAKRGR